MNQNKIYKALMIDVDGTLVLNKEASMPSPRVTETINTASDIIHIGVATSRPLFMLKDIFSHLDLSGPSIINGGAQIIDAQTKRIFWEQELLLDDFYMVSDTLESMNLPFFIHDGQDDIPFHKGFRPTKPYCILCVSLAPSVADMLVEKLTHIPRVAVYKIPDWEKRKLGVIISHASATKQHGIFEVAQVLKINTHEIIGIGEGYNDFPLLMACGLKVAMGNAVPELKEIADYIAPSVEEDGVADVIEKFVLQ